MFMRGITKFVLIGLGIVFLYFVNGLIGEAAATIEAGMFLSFAPQFCHAQFYTVKTGVLLPAGTCAAGSVFLF